MISTWDPMKSGTWIVTKKEAGDLVIQETQQCGFQYMIYLSRDHCGDPANSSLWDWIRDREVRFYYLNYPRSKDWWLFAFADKKEAIFFKLKWGGQ